MIVEKLGQNFSDELMSKLIILNLNTMFPFNVLRYDGNNTQAECNLYALFFYVLM